MRRYLHGDVEEAGERWFDARAQSFEPLPAREGTAIDVARLRLELRNWRDRPAASRSAGQERPDDAPNVFASHPLFSAGGCALRKALQLERRRRR